MHGAYLDFKGMVSLDPPLLSPGFGKQDPAGILTRAGYCFRMTVNGAKDWACIAWPASCEKTGGKTLFVDKRMLVHGASNERTRYSGTTKVPKIQAALMSQRARTPEEASLFVSEGVYRGQNDELWRPMR